MVDNLVERIRKQDRGAMRQLYDTYVEELSSVCYRYVPKESDAKDVLQNSFVKIFTSIPSMEYRGEASFKGWMSKIVANEALGFLRNRKRMLFVEHDVAMPDLPDESPATELVSPEELHRLVSELPDGYRTVLNLYVFEGYPHRKIGELLGIKESTSATQLHHAKRLLAKRIKEIINGKR
ncbi:MAG: sigma-70 family RNA polymerase sigma factor [Prevotella sp.]|nr:sigma-70 family RNA polymerase sigma factor [Prevotella sp.]MBQ4294489.1 sigma-70 family RNA polymerase sigma factor [Prevotella sp.]